MAVVYLVQFQYTLYTPFITSANQVYSTDTENGTSIFLCVFVLSHIVDTN